MTDAFRNRAGRVTARVAAVPTVVLVANARLPTEKAHGHAIVKLSEAFGRLGVDMELWYPRRRQIDADLDRQSVFDYYGVEATFAAYPLPNLDVVVLDRFLPEGLFRALFVAHEAAWGVYVARRAVGHQADLYLTRDLLVAWALARLSLPTVLEIHAVPRGIRRQVLPRLATLPGLRGVVALTEGNKQALIQERVPPEIITVSGSAVDATQYQNLPSKEGCRAMHGLPNDRVIVGHVGRLETLGQDKAIPDLIRAVGLLRSRHQISPLILCVGGPMNRVPAYVQLASELGLGSEDIRFVDQVPPKDVPSWIRTLDIAAALYPATEHMARFASPLKLFEYAAAQASIVATDLPTMREALAGNSAAVFTPPGSHAAIADAIEELVNRNGLMPQQGTGPRRIPTWEDRARGILALVDNHRIGTAC